MQNREVLKQSSICFMIWFVLSFCELALNKFMDGKYLCQVGNLCGLCDKRFVILLAAGTPRALEKFSVIHSFNGCLIHCAGLLLHPFKGGLQMEALR